MLEAVRDIFKSSPVESIELVCAAHNVPQEAEADIMRVQRVADILPVSALTPGRAWLDYSPDFLKKHNLVLGYEYNCGDGTYYWSYYNQQYVDEYSAAFDESAENVFQMYTHMVNVGRGVMYVAHDPFFTTFDWEDCPL